MHSRIAALVATSVVALGLGFGVHAPRAHAADVTEVGGGAFGVAVSIPGGPGGGAYGMLPTPSVVLPPQGIQPKGYGYSGSHGSLSFVIGQANEMSVATYGTLDGDPYATSFAWVQGIEFYDHELADFDGIKTQCSWDNTEVPVFATTYVISDGDLGYHTVETTEIPLAGGGRAVLNDQHIRTDADTGRQLIYVDGLHVYLPGGGDVVIAESSCDPLKPPLLGYAGTTDSRASLCSVYCPISPYNNTLVQENCYDNVDNNGDGLTDNDDPACAYVPPIPCKEDGIDHLQSTPADGTASRVVHEQVEPAVIDYGLNESVHGLNCYVIEPYEDYVDAWLSVVDEITA